MLFVLYFYTMVQVWRITSVEEGLLQIGMVNVVCAVLLYNGAGLEDYIC